MRATNSGHPRRPAVRGPETGARRRRSWVLLLLLLLVTSQSRSLTRVGTARTMMGTSLSQPPVPDPPPDPAGDDPASPARLPDAEAEIESAPVAGSATAAAEPPPDRFTVVGPALDPMATTRKRQRARLVGRAGGPLAPKEPPEDRHDDPPIDTGLP